MGNRISIDRRLFTACEKKDGVKVKTLLTRGADPCHLIKHNRGTFTAAIHEAACYEDDSTDILKTIIESGKLKNIDVLTAVEDAGHTATCTPLMLACCIGNIKSANMLLENGADVTVQDNFNYTVIYHACMSGKPSMAEECLKWNGVNVNQCGVNYKTPLMLACRDGNVGVVRVLLSAGADVELKDDEGNSAAWYGRNNKGVTDVLVNHLTNVNSGAR